MSRNLRRRHTPYCKSLSSELTKYEYTLTFGKHCGRLCVLATGWPCADQMIGAAEK